MAVSIPSTYDITEAYDDVIVFMIVTDYIRDGKKVYAYMYKTKNNRSYHITYMYILVSTKQNVTYARFNFISFVYYKVLILLLLLYSVLRFEILSRHQNISGNCSRSTSYTFLSINVLFVELNMKLRLVYKK